MASCADETETKRARVEQGAAPQPIFCDISADGGCVEMESLCMGCGENGVSRFLLTRIPHFRDIIVSAFECPHCGNRNSEVQSAGVIADRGVRQSCLVSTPADLNRQVVVSEHASVHIEDISLEIPPSRGKGYLSTVEGVLSKVLGDLVAGQDDRRSVDPESTAKIDAILLRIREMLACRSRFSFTVDDPSGNSYVENLCAPRSDPKLKAMRYRQTPAQLEAMGFDPQTNAALSDDVGVDLSQTPDGVYCFASNCCACSSPCETRMHLMEIPHFREVIIMSTACDSCGYRTNEVKSGGAVSEQGKRITLCVATEEDLNRDVLKSETATLAIPEIDMHLTTGSLGGRFTTVEGLLRQVHNELRAKAPFIAGDSATAEQKGVFSKLLADIDRICALDLACTVVIDDPLAQSYIQNLYAPDPDPSLTIESYDRTFEQNEELGLNDICVEGYENA